MFHIPFSLSSYRTICAAMKEASETYMKGVMGYTEDKVVSTDFRGEACTCTFDAEAGMLINVWYMYKLKVSFIYNVLI